MSRNCYCRFCGRNTDCGGDMCELCEALHPDEIKQCSDGLCEIVLEEVKPNVFKAQRDDGTFYLTRMV